MIRHPAVTVPIIYLLVQVFAYGIDVGAFSLLHFVFGINPLTSNIAGKVLAGCFALLAHRNFTFKAASEESLFKQAAKYFAFLLANSFAASGLLSVLLLYLPEFTVLVKIVSDVILILFSFMVSKALIFRPSGQL